jgi:voltage-gated potassium channel
VRYAPFQAGFQWTVLASCNSESSHPSSVRKEKKLAREEREKIGAFQILLVALSVYVLVALFIEAVIPLSASSHDILLRVDNIICYVFLYDFFHRFVCAESKLRFLRWGWLDLVSSIPTLSVFRIGRAVRIVRVLRLIRGFRSVKTIGSVLFAHRVKGTLATAVFLSTLLIVFSSIAILHVENGPNSNIHGPEDALWWSIVTITTVGYGDRFPITTEGRFIGVILMISGIGLFAVLSGAFASWFTETHQEAEKGNNLNATNEQLGLLIEEVRALRAEMDGPVSVQRTDYNSR